MASIEGSPRPESGSGAEVQTELSFLNGVITVVKRADDYMAYVDGDTRIWSAGASPNEAIGDLVRTHPDYIVAAIQSQSQE